MVRRALPLGLIATGVAIGIASVAAARAHPGWWFAGESVAASALALLAGLGLIGAGVAAWRRHPASRFGPLLWIAGVAWFLPEWNNPEIGSPLAFTLGLVFAAACPPLVAHAALVYPGGRVRSPAERIPIGAAYVTCLGLVGVLPALLFDPAAEGCAQCPQNLLLLSARGDLAHDLQRVGLQLGPFWAALVLALAALRVARGSVAERRAVLPVLVPAAAYLVAVAWSFQRSAGKGFLGSDSLDQALWAAQAVTLCLLAGGASWEWVRNRRTRAALAALVVDLETSPGPGGLRAALAERLDDPSLQLLHELPDGSLIDNAGLRRAPNPDQELTPLVSDGRTLAVAVHRPGLFDDVGLGQELASAARLALDNDRLQAELRAQLEDLRASRARIVEAGDAERRRLERDLHDGAQQRLVALGLSISLAVAQRGGCDPRLDRAKDELRELLADLRELAHGIYPVALAEEGLAAAVETLAEESRVALRLERPLPEERLDPQVESAAYLVIREMVRDGRRSWSSVDARREGDWLVLDVAGDGGPPDEIVLVEDRVGAVGGGLELGAPADGVTSLRVELPCG